MSGGEGEGARWAATHLPKMGPGALVPLSSVSPGPAVDSPSIDPPSPLLWNFLELGDCEGHDAEHI